MDTTLWMVHLDSEEFWNSRPQPWKFCGGSCSGHSLFLAYTGDGPGGLQISCAGQERQLAGFKVQLLEGWQKGAFYNSPPLVMMKNDTLLGNS